MKIIGLMAAILIGCATAAQAAVTPPGPSWLTLPEPPPLPHADYSGYVTHDGAQLYYAVFNANGGNPVLLLHGGMASSDCWGFEIPKLMAHHTVIVMDTRGHGRSGWDPRAPLSYDQMAGDAIAVLDAAHATKVAVVGVSDGGIVGLLLAIHKSERVRALLAWGANFNTDDEPQGPPDPAFKTMGHDFMAQREAEYRRLSPTPDGFPQLRQALNTLYDHEPNIPPEDLKRITAPTIIADGDHEQFISRAHTQKLAALIPGGRLVILPNVSHGGFEQDPEGFHQIVAGLLGDR